MNELDLTIREDFTIKLNAAVGGAFEIELENLDNMSLVPSFVMLDCEGTELVNLSLGNGVTSNNTLFKMTFKIPKGLVVGTHKYILKLSKPSGDIVSLSEGICKIK